MRDSVPFPRSCHICYVLLYLVTKVYFDTELVTHGNMVEMEDTTDQPKLKKGPSSVDKSGIMEPENQEKVNTPVSSAEDESPGDPASHYISRESREGLEAVDGIPKAQNLFQVEGQTQSKTVKADLLVYLPSGVSPSKLDGLGETMMNHGVSITYIS